MSVSNDFADFLSAFFKIFSQKTFRGSNYLTYIDRPAAERSGDEASVVDTAIVGPLLGLLGFEPGERVYNQQRDNARPDFAPTDPVYGRCFVVEDKSTALTLNFDLADPKSHLSQLRKYSRSAAVRLGWLTDGKQFTVWDFADADSPERKIDLDLIKAIQAWGGKGSSELPTLFKKPLYDLFDLCSKRSFTDPRRLERELAISLEQWEKQALSLDVDSGNDTALVETVKLLIKELQRDARRMLDGHLTRYAQYLKDSSHLAGEQLGSADRMIKELRGKVSQALDDSQALMGLEIHERSEMEAKLNVFEQDARAYPSPKALMADLLEIINAARARKYADKPKSSKPWKDLRDVGPLRNALQTYSDKVFALHQRRATLRQTYRVDLAVHDDYTIWSSLVQETMLGGLNEEQRRDEFALQASYVVFIRLLLIRVCEDKGIFRNRFISDGGLEHWQKDIQRYLEFANGNPYSHLLDMAYANAQNIYAHFFTGRELFNWYLLDKKHLVMALHRLSRFNFASVDSDIIGTIYNTYVSEKEKKEKGQYYTPHEVVNYILDEVGYKSGPEVIGHNKRLIDPACGSGSFLVAAAKRLVDAYKEADEEIEDPEAVLARVQDNLFGFDLNPFACYLSEVNLLIQVLDLVKLAHDAGKRPMLKQFHVYNVDSLARPRGIYYYAHYNTLLAEESDEVDHIKRREPGTPYANGFAFVVANPPYGAKITEEYKDLLRSDWARVFYGKPDTYIFFLALAAELLAENGKLGFITPNTYLMGRNSFALREILLKTGRVEQIVDLPQGIWQDATVDCVLTFLAAEKNEQKRRAQQVQINLLDPRDTLDKLTARAWSETLIQAQSRWIDDSPRFAMFIRYDALIQQIEDACTVLVNQGPSTKVLRLGDITDDSQGIIPYRTRDEGGASLFIKPQRDVTSDEHEWKPLLDATGYVGRYELRWGSERPYLKYGDWLWRERKPKYFESEKILLVVLRNKSLKRRLVATYDASGFYNRHNYNNIIANDENYKLKYILALFNSSLLNFWYSRKFDNVNINSDTFSQIPIYPADPLTQSELAGFVDQILSKHDALNRLREQGYVIKQQKGGSRKIDVPYDALLKKIQTEDPGFPTLTLFDAKAAKLLRIPSNCDLKATVSSNVYSPKKFPSSVVLRHNKLWFDVPDESARRFLIGYLNRPQWHDKSWDDFKDKAVMPETAAAFERFFAAELQEKERILGLLSDIIDLDLQIDNRVLDLYGITKLDDRLRILGSAPATEVEEENAITEDDVEDLEAPLD